MIKIEQRAGLLARSLIKGELKMKGLTKLLVILKKLSLLFLLISGSFLSTSLAGRQLKPVVVNKLANIEFAATSVEEMLLGQLARSHEDEAVEKIHERLLRANTRDYGRYDPAPALVKPPFKLIPN